MRYIEQWCNDVVSYIRFKPDRPAVKQELMEHMQDKYDGYIEEGFTPSEAEQKTIREMGSDRETGLLLRKIHKPYLGWLLRLTQWALAIVLIMAVVNGVEWGKDVFYDKIIYEYRDPFEMTRYETGYGDQYERLLYLEPYSSAKCNGYTFTVTKVAYWEGMHQTPLAGERDVNYFEFRLEVFNPRPWAGKTLAPRWLSAVDSLGNYYYPYFEHFSTTEDYSEPFLWGNGRHTAPFTYVWDMELSGYVSQQADWIDLRYDRGGKEFTIRIDLTGGVGA